MFDGGEVISNKYENLKGKINIVFEGNIALKFFPLPIRVG